MIFSRWDCNCYRRFFDATYCDPEILVFREVRRRLRNWRKLRQKVSMKDKKPLAPVKSVLGENPTSVGAQPTREVKVRHVWVQRSYLQLIENKIRENPESIDFEVWNRNTSGGRELPDASPEKTPKTISE